jgi:pyrophosphate--fructose-6-phosphate 1-phosphotransferase
LGAVTAAEQGAIFFENVVNECTASPRTLVIHEVMGRHSGLAHRRDGARLPRAAGQDGAAAGFNLDRRRKEFDAVYLPELKPDIEAEARRLKAVMDEKNCASIFLSEGASVEQIVAEMESRGQMVERDAFGHVKLDKVNVGDWFSKQFSKLVGAERVLVQKSGYFARSAAPNAEDLALIKEMVHLAVESGLAGQPGVIGMTRSAATRCGRSSCRASRAASI